MLTNTAVFAEVGHFTETHTFLTFTAVFVKVAQFTETHKYSQTQQCLQRKLSSLKHKQMLTNTAVFAEVAQFNETHKHF